MKYEIKKIAVNEYNRDGSKVYKYGFEFKTWRELTTDIERRSKQSQLDIFVGEGSDIFHNGEIIGNTSSLLWIDKPIRQVTLTEFLSDEF